MQFNKNTIALLIKTIRKYGWMDLPSYGTSMYPLIQKGNICRFVTFDSETVKKGDILLYHSSSGQLIAHRFICLKKTNNRLEYVLKGDTNPCIDEPIFPEQIIGILVTIDREKRKIYMNDFSAILWSYIITTFPILSKILKTYLSFKSNIKSRSGVSV